MMDGSLGDRGKALEDAFFTHKNQELLAKLVEELQHSEQADALKAASGIEDDSVIADLLEAGIGVETLAAFSLYPLVAVAWADGRIEQNERDAVEKAAHDKGIADDSAAHALISHWLHEQPPSQLLDDWKAYAKAVTKSLKPAAKAALAAGILERAHDVAEAAGGILGIGAISNAEQQMLNELGEAFG